LRLTPWWSPSERAIAWAASRAGAAGAKQYVVVIGEGRTSGVDVAERYQSPLDRFGLELEVLGWISPTAFAYRTLEGGGLWGSRQVFIADENGSRVFPEGGFWDVGGEVEGPEIDAARAEIAALLKTHPPSHPVRSRMLAGRSIVVSLRGNALPWDGSALRYPAHEGRLRVGVSRADRMVAEWDVEVGPEGGTLWPYWTEDAKSLALMDRRWELRFSGLVRLSDGESIHVAVSRVP
jgi:hypothetical protein